MLEIISVFVFIGLVIYFHKLNQIGGEELLRRRKAERVEANRRWQYKHEQQLKREREVKYD